MSLLSISLTALSAAQAGLTTTGHNISNANVDGYSRQRVAQSAMDPLFSGSGFYGQGTRIDTIQRVYSGFLQSQVLAASSARTEFDTYATEIKQIDNLLANESAGLSPAIQGFFKGIQELSTNPSSIPSRQALMSAASTLVERFHALDQRLGEIRTGVESQMAESATTINALAKQVADLNQRIRETEVAGAEVAANDLHDLRDRLIKQINDEVRVTSTTQSDGSINLYFGNGQPLVVGKDATALSVGPSPNNPEDQAVYMTLGGVNIRVPDSLINGGRMGGLLRFRDEALLQAETALGRLAVGISKNVNDIHAQGVDLDGQLGGRFFSNLTPVIKQSGGTGTATVSGTYYTATSRGIEDLKAEDYTLTYATATGYTMRRQSDNTIVYQGATPPDGTTTDATDTDKTLRYGFSLSITGTPVDGDRWVVKPTRDAAAEISLAIQDVRKIAAGLPFAMAAETGNSGTAKIGGGTIVATVGASSGAGTGIDTVGADGIPDFNAITLTFNSATNTFSAVDSTGTAITLRVRSGASTSDPKDAGFPGGTTAADNTYNPALDGAGKTFEFGSPAISFTITGTPGNGDSFRITANSTGISDNRNALALAGLQNVKTMLSGGASYEYAYSQLVSDVGTKSRDAEIGVDAQTALLEQAQAAQQSLSGVNLDEEAANLLRYQQAYQAAARAMNIASKLFDEILNLA
ncbi:flagellar hook-associated protein FlgK [Viridibacterium curvum]|uniref:Flagellar hook-associated protein 1 n=1 Tax=Viridibacterium curvum TaxID=1101404 RepID=A0ABP9QB34_9RHOO